MGAGDGIVPRTVVLERSAINLSAVGHSLICLLLVTRRSTNELNFLMNSDEYPHGRVCWRCLTPDFRTLMSFRDPC